MTPVELPEKPVEGLYYPTPVTPEEAFQAIGRLRKDARDEIDRLIRFLDKTDDYVSRELEDSVDDNPQGDDSELEASLGSLSEITDQTRWAERCSGVDDAEDEHDGREPEILEANLGSLDRPMDQRRTMLASGVPWSVVDGEGGAA